ncbi:hypothetical protein F5B20DRAFT_519434 [Whalleya microplaca]|nr:hypothetical protein F5B20DRAFT_519434 [Whalleya microplaca]
MREYGMMIPDKDDPMYHFFTPFDSSAPTDPALLERRQQLQDAIDADPGLAHKVDKLMEVEIDKEGWLALTSEDIFNPVKACTLEFFEKVELLARYRLLDNEPSPSYESPDPSAVVKRYMKMYAVTVSEFGDLNVKDFMAPASPELGIHYFHHLLINATSIWQVMGFWYRNLLGPEEEDEDKDWSYRLVDVPRGSRAGKPQVSVDLNWSPVNTYEQYEGMLLLCRDLGRSAIFIRTSALGETRRIAEEKQRNTREIDEAPAQQHSADEPEFVTWEDPREESQEDLDDIDLIPIT